ncbi:hypothetical protein ABI_16670 [Asticcacaulis biprosthecium C19]|uniref:Uncharacterized protein n=1 Tax=Asticcacaulis biprosthecium C19 TaxID=715226 RepID=F4QJX0_9CAUL|nr:hypothetical protein ABI_16670 [Asticcacaulis biprosthecium C19]
MDMADLDRGKANLGVAVTPAAWVNGYTYACRQMLMYALEFNGFPFAPGYHWGLAAGR